MLEQTANRKLVILDPSLKDMGGHYYEYDVAIAAAALRRGRDTWIYAHKSCGAGLAIPGGNIHPWFSAEWSATGGRARTAVRFLLARFPVALRIPLARSARRIWRLAKKDTRPVAADTAAISPAAKLFEDEVTTALRHARCGKYDIIFLPTIRTSELFALWNSVRRAAEFQALQFHIVLRRDAAEMDLPEDGAPGISHLFRQLQGTPAGNAFHFYCDTEQLCGDYASLSAHRVTFRLLPIPFPVADPDPVSLEKWSAGPAVKLVYLGGARREKGFHLLGPAQDLLRKRHAEKLFWRLQAPINASLEEPEVIAARRDLSSVRDGSVELVERSLTSAEFQSLLLSADLVLLPYLPEFYQARSSGILVQVLAAGKPVIVPAKTWLSSQTNGLGAVEFESAADFPQAVLKAVGQLPTLSREARERSAAYAAFHDADGLLGVLEEAVSDGAGQDAGNRSG